MNNQQFVSWEQAVNWLVEQPEHQELVQQCYFDRPVLQAVQRYAASEEWQELIRWLPQPTGKALDLGAGNGIVSYALAKRGWEVCALEPDPSEWVGAGAIRNFARSENLPIEVIEQWGEAIPCDNDSFELVMARQVIHHANDLNQMYRELSRVLKPGGTLIAFRDHVIDSESSLKKFQDNHPLHNLYGGENAFRISEYESAIAAANLTIVKKLNQFDSVINYAPRTAEDLKHSFAKIGLLPPTRYLVRKILLNDYLFPGLLRIASRLNRRPGRLVSYICTKEPA